MKGFGKLGVFFVAFLLAIYLIFFYSTHKVPGTGETKTSFFSLDGINGFKKGLDIAGGVRLTYKIDMSKYQQLYGNNSSEYYKTKKRVEDIILKNIDSRVSKLGVSDYSSYIQTLNNEEYIVVEIGGLKDIDEAKNIIGKTVELEFKIPFESQSKDPKILVERGQKAEGILTEVLKTPDLFEQIGTGKQSEDVYYEKYTEKTLAELPIVYEKNINKLKNLEKGKVLPFVLSGEFASEFAYDNGNLKQNVLNGWTVIKLNDKKLRQLDVIPENKIKNVAKDNEISTVEKYEKQKIQLKAGDFQYNEVNKEIIYSAGELFTGEQAYNLDIYTYPKANTLGKSPDEAKIINDKAQQDLEAIKTALSSNIAVNVSGSKVMYTGWLDAKSISSYITNFSMGSGETIKVFEQVDTYFVVKVLDSKDAGQSLTKTIILSNVDKSRIDSLTKQFKEDEVYSFENIFVKDYPSWVLAQDPQTKEILNGEYFKYANIEQGKTGKPVVVINFDDKGKDIFCNLTQAYVNKQMAIFVGGELKTAPNIREKICGGGAQIDGNFDNASAKKLINDLNEGALPAKLILAHEDKISPSLGDNALKGAFVAGMVGFVLIFLLMLAMYGPKKAFISVVSLIVYLSILFGIVKLIGYSLSLSGIAAIILNLGMGVDANVLIFERLREELAQKKSFSAAIKDAVERSWAAIRDGNLTIAFIGLLLFSIGTNIFKGFGFMMLVNIFLTFIVIVPLTAELLRFFYQDKR